ncbi:hypothetical protein BgiMline_022091 [Biomphalaria glabrata]|uniref:Uncharacterized protein LOC106054644 isoform X1 n=2 Tax=Biomphalaria glabrata TaxID=6526 RepID=A0A9U8DY05_BIOGL|nr:uncharacterized protein LOC106054644 isoform X1 [Biomphalaria glabrata]KAI8756458.1 hypothetical protein BgiMline_009973 [Biomphalaria glabrata]
MATVFSNVQADISDELISKFPPEFDFDALLRKICDYAGVSIDPTVTMDKTDCGEDPLLLLNKPLKYRVKGLWLGMEKTYRHLVMALNFYGTGLAQAFEDQENINLDVSPDEQEILNDDNGAVYNPQMKTIPQDTSEDSKRQRRPRKSPRQSRKFIEEITDVNFGENGLDEHLLKPKSEVVVSNNEERTCEAHLEESVGEEYNSLEENLQQVHTDCKEEVKEQQIRKRGRPRKNSSPFHLTTKKLVKTKSSQQKPKIISVSTVSESENHPSRRRGRPKVYNDEEQSEFPCSDCSFVAKKRAKLRSHKLRMHLASPTKCDLCTKVFPNKRYMLRHRASHVAPQHCCDVCGKMYKIRKAMLEHRKTHDMEFKKTKMKCETCSKSFCNRYILECHIRDIHMGQKKSYLCATCGKSFTTKHSLAEHNNAHTGVKPHVCEHCGKSFSYESALRDHRFTHTDSKHFWCTHCQKGFSQRSGLKMHMRIHRQHKSFVCPECGRGFTQKQALQRHERVHKGEKPFVCKHCGRFFTDASIIRRHLILVHKINKDSNHWREDIVCTVKPQNDYQVKKVGEEGLSDVDKEKEDILKVVAAQPRSNTKGPSRAFSRTYPRRVALLDDEGNVIAPPELPPRPAVQRSKSTESNESNGHSKALAAAVNNATLILTNENSSDLDSSSQVMNQRYVEGAQWDALSGQIGRTSTTHLENMILDDTAQHEIQRGIEHVQGLHKLIKYESLQPSGIQMTNHNILTQPSPPSPSSSPISFTSQPLAHSRVMETSFETLPQAAHTGSQYYEGRTSSTQWSSMFYYSQLASQFGMSINAEYPYVSGSSGGGSTTAHLTQYSAHSPSGHQTSPTTLILQSQPHLPQIESPKQDELRNSSSQIIMNSGLHQNNELVRHVNSMKLVTGETILHPTDLILQHELQNSPSHGLGSVEAHHVTTLEHMGVSLADTQSILVQHVSDSRQQSPDIPPRNTTLIHLKHK